MVCLVKESLRGLKSNRKKKKSVSVHRPEICFLKRKMCRKRSRTWLTTEQGLPLGRTDWLFPHGKKAETRCCLSKPSQGLSLLDVTDLQNSKNGKLGEERNTPALPLALRTNRGYQCYISQPSDCLFLLLSLLPLALRTNRGCQCYISQPSDCLFFLLSLLRV